MIEKDQRCGKIGDVTFICAMPFPGGGLGDGIVKQQLTYLTQFTIQNNSAERVVIKPEDITIFREADTETRCISSGRNWSQSRGRRPSTMARRSSIWKLRKVCRKRTAPALMNCVCATMVKPLYSLWK